MLWKTSKMQSQSLTENNSIPVFIQKSKTDMYNYRIIHHGCWYDSIDAVGLSREDIETDFSVFYSHQVMSPIIASSHLLPLITETITAPATVRHGVNIGQKNIQKVNPDQISVITGDEPVYANSKIAPVDVPNEIQGYSMDVETPSYWASIH